MGIKDWINRIKGDESPIDEPEFMEPVKSAIGTYDEVVEPEPVAPPKHKVLKYGVIKLQNTPAYVVKVLLDNSESWLVGCCSYTDARSRMEALYPEAKQETWTQMSLHDSEMRFIDMSELTDMCEPVENKVALESV